MTLIFFK